MVRVPAVALPVIRVPLAMKHSRPVPTTTLLSSREGRTTLKNDERLVERVNVFCCPGVGMAFPECHLVTIRTVEHVPLDSGSV